MKLDNPKLHKRVANKELNFRQVSDDNGFFFEDHIGVFQRCLSPLGNGRDKNVLVVGAQDHFIIRCFADYFFNGIVKYISFDVKNHPELTNQKNLGEERLICLGGFSAEAECHLDNYLCKWEYKDIDIVVDLMSNPYKKVNFSKFKLQKKGSLYIMLNTMSGKFGGPPFPKGWEKGESHSVVCVNKGLRPKHYHERDTIIVFKK